MRNTNINFWFDFKEKIYKSNVTLLNLNKSFSIIQDKRIFILIEFSKRAFVKTIIIFMANVKDLKKSFDQGFEFSFLILSINLNSSCNFVATFVDFCLMQLHSMQNNYNNYF